MHIMLPYKIKSDKDKNRGSNDLCEAFYVLAQFDSDKTEKNSDDDSAYNVGHARYQCNFYSLAKAPLFLSAYGEHRKPMIWNQCMQQAD